MRRTQRESELHPLISAILSGQIPPNTVAAIESTAPCEDVIQLWRDRRLVEDCPDGAMTLTASGSSFDGDMVLGLTTRYLQRP